MQINVAHVLINAFLRYLTGIVVGFGCLMIWKFGAKAAEQIAPSC